MADLPETPDLAIIFLPPAAAERALIACADKGITSVIIQSAGFAEVGPEGRALQERLVAIARARGLRLLGPNCLGLLDGVAGKAFTFMPTDR